MTYFRAELVQLIVSRSDSELEVQRCGMKKNTLTVDPIVLQDEWDNVKNRPQTAEVGFLKTGPRKPSFRFLNFEVGSVQFGFLKTDIRNFHRIPHTPSLETLCILNSSAVRVIIVIFGPGSK